MRIPRPIAISLSPNTQPLDIRVAFFSLINPLTWFDRRSITVFEKMVATYFGNGYRAISFNSGRTSLAVILRALNIGSGDEVMVQAFSCVVVANSIKKCGARTVFCDIDRNFNFDPSEITKKCTRNTKAVVVQNTFGINCDYGLILKNIKKMEKKFGHRIYLIEDCAHSFGGKYNGKKIGTIGDVSFFSLGRDKVLSSVSGGVVLVRDQKLFKNILKQQSKLDDFGVWNSIRDALHPLLMNLIVLPVYNLGFGRLKAGKVILELLLRLGMIQKPVSLDEMDGKPTSDLRKFSPLLAVLAINQMQRLDKFNIIRVRHAEVYSSKLKNITGIVLPNAKSDVWLRFPILVPDAKKLISYAKSKGLLLGKWYEGIIDPNIGLKNIGYKQKSCPNAETAATKIVNLPTYPLLTEDEVDKVVSLTKKWIYSKVRK